MVADPMNLVSAMIRQRDAMAEMLNGFHLQVVELASGLPGFVIGDTPVVHAALANNRYGFRDHLALGDADFIIGPLTRTTAACFTVQPLRPVLVTTRMVLDAINAIFLRAASAEVGLSPRRREGARADPLATRPPTAIHPHGSLSTSPQRAAQTAGGRGHASGRFAARSRGRLLVGTRPGSARRVGVVCPRVR